MARGLLCKDRMNVHGAFKTIALIAAAALLAACSGGSGPSKSLDQSSLDPQPGVIYYIDDHLGSSNLVTDSQGTVLHEESRYPFGVERGGVGDAAVDYTYTGKEYDDETGLVYFGGRYYSPLLGRWATPDPLFVDNPAKATENPLASNLYAYVNNSPINFVDPDGFEPWPTIDFPNATMLPSNAVERYYADAASRAVGEIGTMFVPIVNDLRDAYEFAVGKDLISGSQLKWSERMLAGAGLFAGSGAAVRKASDAITNPIPDRLARVIPGKGPFNLLGPPGNSDVFVTAADDIAGLDANQLSQRLTIEQNQKFTIIEFDTPSSGIASPINRTNPGFVGGGRTAGGAREFVIPNQPIPGGAQTRMVE